MDRGAGRDCAGAPGCVTEVDRIRARWRTRRKMAWIAFWALVLIVPAAFWLPDTAEKVAGIIQLVAPSLAAIVMVYIGAATYDDVQNPATRKS